MTLPDELSPIWAPSDSAWKAFCRRATQASVFHTPEFMSAMSGVAGVEPAVLALEDGTGEIQALLTSDLDHHLPLKAGRIGTRAVLRAEPCVQPRVAAEEILRLLDTYNERIAEKAVFTEVRNSRDPAPLLPVFHDAGFQFVDHSNILVDLRQPLETLWKALRADKRRGVNKAEKLGVTCKILTDLGEVQQAYRLLQETYQRARVPLYPERLFLNIQERLSPPGMAHFLAAYQDSEIIGVRLLLTYGGRALDWFAGSSMRGRELHANDLLVWRSFLMGKERGATSFDFGGAGEPKKGSGVRDFKSGFGGETVNHGRFLKVHSPALYRLAQAGYTVWKRFG